MYQPLDPFTNPNQITIMTPESPTETHLEVYYDLRPFVIEAEAYLEETDDGATEPQS